MIIRVFFRFINNLYYAKFDMNRNPYQQAVTLQEWSNIIVKAKWSTKHTYSRCFSIDHHKQRQKRDKVNGSMSHVDGPEGTRYTPHIHVTYCHHYHIVYDSISMPSWPCTGFFCSSLQGFFVKQVNKILCHTNMSLHDIPGHIKYINDTVWLFNCCLLLYYLYLIRQT